ncbi:7141_t:CDS:2, partial [Dentiscutata heterogama]
MAESQLQFNSCGIPTNFDLFYVYNPKNKYDTFTLSRNQIGKNHSPSRLPSSYLLLKNCLRLEFESQFPQHKLEMSNLYRFASEIWKTMPEEVKSIYVNIAEEAKSIYNKKEMFPNYKFMPKKRIMFKSNSPSLSASSFWFSHRPYEPKRTPIFPSLQDIYLSFEESTINYSSISPLPRGLL